MNHVVTPEQMEMMTISFSPAGKRRLLVEASSMRWAPGYWPQFVTVDGCRLGPRQVHRLDGDLACMVYPATGASVELHVLND